MQFREQLLEGQEGKTMNKLRKYFNSLNLQNKLRLCFIF